ncbi:MAG: bifunctional UDP-N-acetylglucosamine diphosphorylase/glucosamine-1-phosphate N-acetyltransferase GlmU [Myxococcota bacterium]
MGETDALLGLILAAGRGTRMRSETPKLLHTVCGRPILLHAIRTVQEVGPVRIVLVLGPDEESFRGILDGFAIDVVRQETPDGTGDAVLRARSQLADHLGPVLIMHGDHPLYRPGTFGKLVERFRETGADLALLTGELPDPSGYGRIVRGENGSIERIVEETDAGAATRSMQEVNLAVYVARAPFLLRTLEQIGKQNHQAECFLTDIVEVALREGRRVETMEIADPREAPGVNDRVDLARAESILRARIAEQWMHRGVTFIDPDRTYVDADVEIGEETVLEPGCTLRRGTRVGRRCRISVGAVIDGATLGDDVVVKPQCWLEDSTVGARCVIGPSAHLRPGSVLADEVRVGNFVEVKNSRLGRGTKADHLSYIGDADIGSGVTIGCGAITVNYDGAAKHRTRIGDGAFIGCNSNLIAPIEVEPGAYVAAGSTITKPVPEGALGVARGKQRNIEGWRARRFGGTTPKDGEGS